MALRLTDLISKKKKNKLHVQHTFSSNKKKKQICTLFCLSLFVFPFCLAVVLHDHNTVLYD